MRPVATDRHATLATVTAARRLACEACLHARITRLLRLAEAQSGHAAMTTHEAKDHFRAKGARVAAHRMHVLLGQLAGRAPG